MRIMQILYEGFFTGTAEFSPYSNHILLGVHSYSRHNEISARNSISMDIFFSYYDALENNFSEFFV
jgi:hypothetical protein